MKELVQLNQENFSRSLKTLPQAEMGPWDAA
jgi:hypothetical protein